MRKRILALASVAAVLAIPALAIAQTAGPFDLSWSVMPGGGGTSSGGQYTLTGGVGQPLTDVSSGGNYTVASGFYAGGGGPSFRFYAPNAAKDGPATP